MKIKVNSLITGGEYLVEALKLQGVTCAFTLHGGHLDSIYTAAREHGIDLVDTRHEQAAGIAASGWARATGEVGLAMVTAGGGVSNVVTALANAYVDCVPMVVIGGAPPLRDVDSLPVNSGYDQLEIVKPVTKWSRRVTHVELLGEMVERAFHWARSGRPGPTYLDVPGDVIFDWIERAEAQLYPRVEVSSPTVDSATIDRILESLAKAERPVIMAGGGVAQSDAGVLLTEFAETTHTPVLLNNKSRGVIPSSHPYLGKSFGAIAKATAKSQPADLIIQLGSRLGLYTGGRRSSVIPETAKVIQVDIASEELGKLRQIDMGVQADARKVLEALVLKAQTHNWARRQTWIDSLIGSSARGNNADESALTPRGLAQELSEVVPLETLFVVDGGETPAWLDSVARVDKSHSWFGHGYLGIMGEGMPLAVGVQSANPDKPVVCFVGDGALGFNISEFDTMVRHGLPVIVVVNNDAQWSMSAHGQDLIYGDGKRLISELRHSSYDKVAEAFGGYGETITTRAELGPAIQRARESGLPACINALTVPGSVAAVTKRFVGTAAQGLLGDGGERRIPYAEQLEIKS